MLQQLHLSLIPNYVEVTEEDAVLLFLRWFRPEIQSSMTMFKSTLQEACAVARSQEASYIALTHKTPSTPISKSTAQTPKFSPTHGPRPLNPYHAAVT